MWNCESFLGLAHVVLDSQVVVSEDYGVGIRHAKAWWLRIPIQSGVQYRRVASCAFVDDEVWWWVQ